MRITEVRIKLMEKSEDRLRGFCSVTFDECFVVRDLKIIEGNNGPFVAMPSRKLTANCHNCRTKNHLRAKYCNQCGTKQRGDSIAQDADGRARLYADIAHPVNASCREMIQKRVIEEFYAEVELSRQPGYVTRYDDEYETDWDISNSRGPGTVDKKQDEPNQRIDDPEIPGSGSHSEQKNPVNPSYGQPSKGRDSEAGFGHGILDQ